MEPPFRLLSPALENRSGDTGNSNARESASHQSGTDAFFQQSWAELDAVDPAGYVGVRIHAIVHASGTPGLRFSVRFRDEQSRPIQSNDLRYGDQNGEAVNSFPLLSETSDVTAFLPATVLELPIGDHQVQAIPELLDAMNRVVATGPITSYPLHRGAFTVTRIQQMGTGRGFRVGFQTTDRRRGVDGTVVIRFKDSRGLPLHGHPPYANAANELMVASRFQVPAGNGSFSYDGAMINVPPGLVPPLSTAEITLYDSAAGSWLTRPISVLFR